VLFLGTNDLRRDATAEQVIAGLTELVARAKDRGLTVVAATIIPRNPVPRGFDPNLGFTAARNVGRRQINTWIRNNDELDAVLDFDAAVQSASNPDLIEPIFDCDGIHPNVLGYATMGRSIDLSVFTPPR
jgi:lysophospholipase L1-like esterase